MEFYACECCGLAFDEPEECQDHENDCCNQNNNSSSLSKRTIEELENVKFIIKDIHLETQEVFLSDTPNKRILRHTGRAFVEGSVHLANGTTMDVKNDVDLSEIEGLTLKEISEKMLKDIFEGEEL